MPQNRQDQKSLLLSAIKGELCGKTTLFNALNKNVQYIEYFCFVAAFTLLQRAIATKGLIVSPFVAMSLR